MVVVDHNVDRGRRAAKRARAAGGTAVDAAKAMINTAFDRAATNIDFKRRISERLRMGPEHPANKARFGQRAEMLRGQSLDVAAATIERWYRTERKAFQIASVFGRPARLPLVILCELRLIVRLLRRHGAASQFPALIEALCEPPSSAALAAAE
jgi:hypothetical protein